MLVRFQRKPINKSKQPISAKSGISFATTHCYLLLSLILICNTFAWYCYSYDTQWRTTQGQCGEYDTSDPHGVQINSDFTQTYGSALINASNTSGALVQIVDTLLYGKQEKAHHINNTWVCIDENQDIVIYGAATNSKHNVYQYWVGSL